MENKQDSGRKGEKKKILVLVDWFAPGFRAGGPIQSCVNFAFFMKDAYRIFVLTTDTDHGESKAYDGIPTDRWISNLHPEIKTNYLRKATLTRRKLKRELMAAEADYIYLNHLFSPLFVIYPLWLKFLGKLPGTVVVCPRGALYESALSVKSWKKTPFLKVFKWLGLHRKVLFHATNEREKKAILRYFPGSKIGIADNLPNGRQPEFHTCRKEKGLVKCIFIARILPIKNLLFLLRAMGECRARVELTIIGPIEDQSYWEQCRTWMEKFNSSVTVTYLGPRHNNELMPILQEHHLFVLPTTGENFGHSIFEALLAGRPVLISDQTPWLGLTARRVGWDLPIDDPCRFTAVLEGVAAWDQSLFDEWARSAWDYARAYLENPGLKQSYFELFA
jgi:glycosyltransferase involved in cell wall biosynthesis